MFEQQGTVEVCAVILDGSLERNVDVTLSTQPGTAQGMYVYLYTVYQYDHINDTIAGVDYSSILGAILRFSETSPNRQCVDITIREDDVFEDPEIFTVTLVDSPSEGIILSPDIATINITDETCTLL